MEGNKANSQSSHVRTGQDDPSGDLQSFALAFRSICSARLALLRPEQQLPVDQLVQSDMRRKPPFSEGSSLIRL